MIEKIIEENIYHPEKALVELKKFCLQKNLILFKKFLPFTFFAKDYYIYSNEL